MAQQHTPGPWSFYDDSNDGKTNRIEIVAIGKTVARIYHSVPAEDLPNARLMAAAPELLEAAQRLLDAWAKALPENAAWKAGRADELEGLEFREMSALRAVIAKATGATVQAPGATPTPNQSERN